MQGPEFHEKAVFWMGADAALKPGYLSFSIDDAFPDVQAAHYTNINVPQHHQRYRLFN